MAQTPAQRRAYAQLWHALKYVAGKECGDATRAQLLPGSTRVALSIRGSVGRQKVSASITGQLLVNHDQQKATSTTPDYLSVIGRMLEGMAKTKRDALLTALADEYSERGEVWCSDDRRKEAKELLEKLRSRRQTTARGSVRFQRPEAT